MAKLGLYLDSHREALFVESPVLDKLRVGLPKRIHRIERSHLGPFRSVPEWRLALPEALLDPAWTPRR